MVAVLFLADRGYALTDEAFYLNWLSSPGLWPTSTTLFGFVYHPLFVALDGDITQVRRVTVVLTLVLSWAAAFWHLGRLEPRGLASSVYPSPLPSRPWASGLTTCGS